MLIKFQILNYSHSIYLDLLPCQVATESFFCLEYEDSINSWHIFNLIIKYFFLQHCIFTCTSINNTIWHIDFHCIHVKLISLHFMVTYQDT